MQRYRAKSFLIAHFDIWAETACSMLQEKAFFGFQIHLIQSPKDLEV
jgi:hypothetical protein